VKRRLAELAFVAGPRLAGGAAAFVMNAVLLTHLAPAAYGAYALCMAIVLLADAVPGASVDMSVLRFSGGPRQADAERAGTRIKLAVVAAGALAAAVVSTPLVHQHFDVPRVPVLAWITWLAAASLMMFRSLLLHWQLQLRFGAYGASDLANSVLRFGAVAVLLVAGVASVESVLAATALAPLAVMAAIAATRGLPFAGRAVSKATVREVAAPARWFFLTYAAANLAVRLDLVLLAALAGAEVTGAYAGGQVFAQIPEMLGAYAAILVTPRLAGWWASGSVLGRLRALVIVAAVIGAVLYAAAAALLYATPTLFPAGFAASGPILLALLPGTLAGMTVMSGVVPFVMMARPRAALVVDIVALPVILVAMTLLVIDHGALGAAWAASAGRIAKALVFIGIAMRAAREAPAGVNDSDERDEWRVQRT
jgi:O-antigen/teichoic acid export membrane protein